MSSTAAASANIFADAEVIHAYTRTQALEDGVLIDVSEVAREAGIKFPVALTAAVWANYVKVPPKVECQDEKGRLWDIVWMMRLAISRTGGETDRIKFNLFVRNNNRRPKLVELAAVCGPGDQGEPVITVMMPDED